MHTIGVNYNWCAGHTTLFTVYIIQAKDYALLCLIVLLRGFPFSTIFRMVYPIHSLNDFALVHYIFYHRQIYELS